MARPPQKLSKRAAHKAKVEARRKDPFVKVRKQRRNPLPFPSDFFAMAAECEREGVLMTCVSKRPPVFKCETLDDKGNTITTALQKAAPPLRGWRVLLPKGEGFSFRTRRDALKFISTVKAAPVEEAANA